MNLRLGVNIDHVATLRNARGGVFPCPIQAALLAAEAGADGITAHLREDRRHIRDRDIERLRDEVPLPLNLEMAATEEMLAIAQRVKPHAVCIVPEKREEVTTEGGLDVIGQAKKLYPLVASLRESNIRVSLFIDPVEGQAEASRAVGAQVVELHTGTYSEHLSHWERSKSAQTISGEGDLPSPGSQARRPLPVGEVEKELRKLQLTAAHAASLGLEVHAGHGLNYENVAAIAAIAEVVELNIGHFLIGEAVFVGLKQAVQEMRRRMDAAR